MLRRLIPAADGVETIEFALVSLTLFFFLFGVVEFGRLYWTRTELQNAAEAGARYCTINTVMTGTPPTVTTPCTDPSVSPSVGSYAATKVYGITIPTSDFTVTPYDSTTNSCGNKVTVNYPFSFIVIGRLFNRGAITLTTTACFGVI